MYYIWSLIATTFIFLAIQYTEYQKDAKRYNAYTLTNFMTFVIIYIIATILFYLLLASGLNNVKMQKGGEYTYIDPSTLKKIPDAVYTGFTPYDNE
jgi:hypothetical protein